MEVPITYRQGDLLFIKTDEINHWVKDYPRKNNIVLRGESTGKKKC